MIPDLSFCNRLTAILFLLALLAALAAIIILSVSVYKKTNQFPGDSEQIKKVPGLLKVADSIRDSSPFSALVCYHKAILMFQASGEGKEKLHHFSEAYSGIGCINSTNGDYKAALKMNFNAMSLARRQLIVNLFRKLCYTR